MARLNGWNKSGKVRIVSSIHRSLGKCTYIHPRQTKYPTLPRTTHAPPQHGVGWVGWGGIPYGYISILDIGYWIYILSSRSCDKYRNIFWIFYMHHFLNMLSWCLSIFSVFHRFLRRPKRCAPKLYVKSRLIFCVSSVLDPIGDRNDV